MNKPPEASQVRDYILNQLPAEMCIPPKGAEVSRDGS